MKYQVGDKVIPISKSTGKPFKQFLNMHEGREFQKNGYVTIEGYGWNGREYRVDDKNNFLECDLIPYSVNKEEAFKQLVQGQLTSEQYERITRTTGSEV